MQRRESRILNPGAVFKIDAIRRKRKRRCRSAKKKPENHSGLSRLDRVEDVLLPGGFVSETSKGHAIVNSSRILPMTPPDEPGLSRAAT